MAVLDGLIVFAPVILLVLTLWWIEGDGCR
jgi:hypothetical protein